MGNASGVIDFGSLAAAPEKLVKDGKMSLRFRHRVQNLITDGVGAVVGVRAEGPDGKTINFHGKNVVLATGGYVSNPELWKELTPQYPLCSYASPMSRGDGILAARAATSVSGGEKYLNTFIGVMEKPGDPCSGIFLLLSPKARAMCGKCSSTRTASASCARITPASTIANASCWRSQARR